MKKDRFLLFIIFLFCSIGEYYKRYSPSLGLLITILPAIYIIPKYRLSEILKNADRNILKYLSIFIFLHIMSYPHAIFIGNVPIETTFLISNMISYPVFYIMIILIVSRYVYKGIDIFKDILTIMTILLVINLVLFKYMGLVSSVHAIPGRLNLPLFAGIYEVAKYCVILTLISGYYYFKSKHIKYLFISLFALISLYLTNSRAQIIFLFVTIAIYFFSTRRMQKYTPVLTISAVPILLSFQFIALKFAQILNSMKIFQFIFKGRTDFNELLIMNSRMLIWDSAINALSGFNLSYLFGFGYQGFYVLGITDFIAKSWGGGENPLNIHLHSGYLMLFYNIGLIGIIVFFLINYKILKKLSIFNSIVDSRYRLMYLVLLYFLIAMIESDVLMISVNLIVLIIIISLSLVSVNITNTYNKRKVPVNI